MKSATNTAHVPTNLRELGCNSVVTRSLPPFGMRIRIYDQSRLLNRAPSHACSTARAPSPVRPPR